MEICLKLDFWNLINESSGEKFKNFIFNSIEITWEYKYIMVSLITSITTIFTTSLPDITWNDKVKLIERI